MSALFEGRTGYNVREGSAILADRFAEFELEEHGRPSFVEPLDVCDCGETRYRGRCHNVGACRQAERSAVRQSLQRGIAASARPAAWNLGGSVD